MYDLMTTGNILKKTTCVKVKFSGSTSDTKLYLSYYENSKLVNETPYAGSNGNSTEYNGLTISYKSSFYTIKVSTGSKFYLLKNGIFVNGENPILEETSYNEVYSSSSIYIFFDEIKGVDLLSTVPALS